MARPPKNPHGIDLASNRELALDDQNRLVVYKRDVNDAGEQEDSVDVYEPGTGGGTDQADWDRTKIRTFLLDNDGGDDDNTGYIDIDPAQVIVPTGKALKTIGRYLELLPRVGAGRQTMLLMKPRADFGPYLDSISVPEKLDYRGVSGYARIIRRGSTDLTNSAVDKILCGFKQAQVGPDAGGAWTVLAGATVNVFSITGTLSAEPALIGRRVRFEGNINPALVNVCRNVYANTGTAITVGFDLPAIPAVGERFFIEAPGAAVSSFNEADNGAVERFDPTTFNPNYPLVLAGIAVTSTVGGASSTGSLVATQYSAFEDRAALDASITVIGSSCRTSVILIEPSYTDEAGIERVIGFGLRTAGASIWGGYFVRAAAVAFVNPSSLLSAFIQASGFEVGTKGSYFGAGVVLTSLGGSGVPLDATGDVYVDNNFSRQTFGRLDTSERRTRIRGISNDIVDTAQLYLLGTNARLNGVISDLASSAPAIKAIGVGLSIAIDDYEGATGNTDVGLDLTDADCAIVEAGLGIAVTVTGTVGNIRLADGAIISWSDLTKNARTDLRGNRVFGTGPLIPTMAEWPLPTYHVYCVNYDTGSDLALGYGEGVDETTAAQAAALVPLKTFEELANRIPVLGRNRKLGVIAIPRAGGDKNFYKKDGSTVDSFIVDTIGYDIPNFFASNGVRDANDKVDLACMSAITGPNGDGSYTVGSVASKIITPVSAAGITQAAARGFFIRWKGNITVALRTQGSTIGDVTDGVSFEALALPTAPAAGDEFFIEKPAIILQTIRPTNRQIAGLTSAGGLRSWQIGGFEILQTASQGGVIWDEGMNFVCMNFTGASMALQITGGLNTNQNYADMAGVQISTRKGLRFTGPLTFIYLEGAMRGAVVLFVCLSTCSVFNFPAVQGMFSGSLFVGLLGIFGNIGSNWYSAGVNNAPNFGATSTALFAKLKTLAGMQVEGVDLRIENATLNNSAGAGLVVKGKCDLSLKTIDGTAAAGFAGVDITAGEMVRLWNAGGNTLTGSLGDVKFTGGTTKTWAQIAAARFEDVNANMATGPGGNSAPVYI